MKTRYNGNRIIFVIDESDSDKTYIPVTLPDGYSVAEMFITADSTLTLTDGSSALIAFPSNIPLKFPVVDSKSPNHFNLRINSFTPNKSLIINIFKFGGIPDTHYFDDAFDPLLVKTKDENENEIEYNIIPSTQFER